MQTVVTAEALRDVVRAWKRAGRRVAFVPTMGNLHAGHYSLVDQARSLADHVVASVFVNPTQFGPNEDFSRYPRTLDADSDGLRAHGCDLLFAPTVDVMYPIGTTANVRVEVPGLSDILDGAVRPGHFSGVATVVTKLLNLVQPDVAIFGRKDYQQLLVIRRLVADLALPVEIVGGETVREENGLAMSSRNQYLSPEQRAQAGVIYATLQAMAAGIRGGRSRGEVEAEAIGRLETAGLKPDYAVIRRADDLERPSDLPDETLVGLVAARLGPARLIDNLLIA